MPKSLIYKKMNNKLIMQPQKWKIKKNWFLKKIKNNRLIKILKSKNSACNNKMNHSLLINKKL